MRAYRVYVHGDHGDAIMTWQHEAANIAVAAHLAAAEAARLQVPIACPVWVCYDAPGVHYAAPVYPALVPARVRH